jgi:hypothetical protein
MHERNVEVPRKAKWQNDIADPKCVAAPFPCQVTGRNNDEELECAAIDSLSARISVMKSEQVVR